jgi:copper chaperone
MSDPIVLKVAMMCAGCSGAVERVLKKMEGAISSLR